MEGFYVKLILKNKHLKIAVNCSVSDLKCMCTIIESAFDDDDDDDFKTQRCQKKIIYLNIDTLETNYENVDQSRKITLLIRITSASPICKEC